MQTILTHKTASLTELRDPAKILAQAGDEPVAILNRNKVEGYFVPVGAIEKISFFPTTPDKLTKAMDKRMPALKATLDYLKDK